MKLRIKGNSVRLRLTKTDVKKLADFKYIEEQTVFGTGTFVYALQSKTDCKDLDADFSGGKITVFIPEILTEDWVNNDKIGFESKIETAGGGQLYILVEKDFQCIDKTTEDQSDNYVNPNKTCL